MKHVKYFSKRPNDSSNNAEGTVKRFSSRNGYVRRFSAKDELSLSSLDPDKYYLYKDSNVTVPGFAIDKGSYIISSSKYSRGYSLTKAYGPYDTAAEAEAYANESGISLIDTSAPAEEQQPDVAEMSGTDDAKFSELEAKVDALTDLVTKLTEKLSKEEEEVQSEETPAEETPATEEVTTEEEVTEEVPAEEPEAAVAEESNEDVCPECGQNPCVCETEEVADNGETENDEGLGEQVPANTGNTETVYTQVPEEDILAQFSNSSKPEPEEVVSMSVMANPNDSMFNVLFK
jgi:hypothetical protein